MDPAYASGVEEIGRPVRTSLPGTDGIIQRHRDRFERDWSGTPERRPAMRIVTADAFLADLRRNHSRHIASGSLPTSIPEVRPGTTRA
jgi:hypothetical protein